MASRIEALILMLLVATVLSFAADGAPQVPCYFIFGDSLMDNGNNNDLVTTAKANYAPYGIDYPDGPTGRFSNGRNIADVVAELLGFETPIPPFATARPEDILRGVNYASGAAGILDESGQHLGARISLNEQLVRHAIAVLRLSPLIASRGSARVQRYLEKCIYTLTVGNNDYINNYFLPQYYETSRYYTLEQYAEILVQQYSKQLSELYKYGARKFGVSGAGYLGCTPAMMAMFDTDACVDRINNAVILFNAKLVTALSVLEHELPGAKFIYIDPPLGYSSDFNVTDKPCCNISTAIGGGQCAPNQTPCNDRDNYVFWDAFHPTESVALVDGATIYEALAPFYASKTKGSSPTSESGLVSNI